MEQIKSNKLSLKKKLLFSLIAIVAFFLLIEIVARSYHSIKYRDTTAFLYGGKFFNNLIEKVRRGESPDIYVPYLSDRKTADNIFEQRHVRNVPLATAEPREGMVFGYLSYINKFSLRNKDIELQKHQDTTRIIALGASFVLGCGVDDKHTWENLLEKELKKLSGRYELINFGGPGSNINKVLTSLIDKVTKFNPDYLIIFSAYNNHALLNHESELSILWKTSHFFYNISFFYAMLREKLSLIIYKDNNYFLHNYNIKVMKSEIDDLMKLYRKRLEQIYTVCNENDINLILGLQPEFIPNGLKDLQNLLDEKQVMKLDQKLRNKNHLSYYEFEYYMQGRFNLEMKRFGEEKDVLIFDAISIFPEDKYAYFVDEIHPNVKGTSLIAKALYSFLVEHNIVK